MRRLRPLFVAVSLSAGAAALADPSASSHWAVLDQYCSKCHNAEDFSGGLAFDTMSPDTIAKDAQVWESVVRKLRGGMMPPPGEKRPDSRKVEALVLWLEGTIDRS